jgi:probable blue pigment (indigoidine) exporter
MSEMRLVGTSAIAPVLWGTTYLVTTQLLPADRPLLAGALRALPAGLLLLAAMAWWLRRACVTWWWRSAILGTLNIGLFFPLLFLAAYRLPGGVAAVVGAAGPFVVAGYALALYGERPPRRVLVAAGIGIGGVALLVLRSTASLDPIALAAAAAGVLTMSLGTVSAPGPRTAPRRQR